MAYELEIYYDTGDDDNNASIYGDVWVSQSFTTSGGFDLTRVSAKILRAGSPGDVVAVIKATDGNNKPTGSDLATSNVVNGNGFTTDAEGEWIDFDFGTPATLSAATKYSIIIKALSGSSSNKVQWRRDTGNGYAGGTLAYSTNSGSSWTVQSKYDLLFRTYSGAAAGPTYVDMAGTVAGAATLTGVLYGTSVPLSGAVEVEASLTGSLWGTSVALAGEIEGACSLVGNAFVAHFIDMAGAVEAASALVAALETKRFIALAGTVEATADLDGFLLSHVWLDEFHQDTRIVAAGNNQIWFEGIGVAAGTMVELTAARDDINTSDPCIIFPLLEKAFVVNGANKKVIDFGNVKITTADVGANPPDRGNILMGGTSEAQMVVDYITTTSGACTIYGKRTTAATFVSGDVVTGTDDDEGAISFTLNANEDSGATVAGGQPHWYDWGPYGGDTAAFGELPEKVYLGCSYRGRAVLSGNPDYPFQWYMSREGNPFDFNYIATDATRATAGGTGNLGQLGDMVRALIPWKDDALAFGCANSFIVLRGNPTDGGYFENIDSKIGVYGQEAWCFDGDGDLYFWGSGGVYKSSRGFGTLTNLTAEAYPDIVDDEDAGPSTHRITFGYDPRANGIQISVTRLSDGSNSCYWLDMGTGGFYPDEFNTDHGAYSMLFYDANDPAYKHLLVGCKDGYIRRFDKTSKNDDGLAIDSYVDYGPIQLAPRPDQEGHIFSVEAELGGGGSGGTESDSNNVIWRIWTDRSADAINEKLSANTAPSIGGTFQAPGRRRGGAVKRKVKGVYAGIKLRNNTLGESWAFEKMIVGIRPAGRAK